MKVLLLLLGLVVLMALPAHTWKPPVNDSTIYADTSGMIDRPSSQDSQKYVRALRNYILHGYWDPQGQGISRQLRSGSSIIEKVANKISKLLKPTNNWMKCMEIAKENAQTVHGSMNSQLSSICDGPSAQDSKKNLKAIRDPADIKSFDVFKLKYNKNYIVDQEDDKKTIFKKNVQDIEEHNRLYKLGKRSYLKQVSFYSDMTKEEYESMNVGCVKAPDFPAKGNSRYREKRSMLPYRPVKVGEEPNCTDYRQCGALNEVTNQGKSPSCWAFSATSCVESYIFLKYEKTLILSEQYLLDCCEECRNRQNYKGGKVSFAMDFLRKGIVLRDTYNPYTGMIGKCNEFSPSKGYKVSGILRIERGNDAALLNALVHKGPISVAIYTSWNFAHYKKGVLDDERCTKDREANHAVVLIGYGTTENGKDYWLLRNSHGEGMGEGGYFKLARDKNKKNHCKISDQAMIPKIK